MRGPISPNSGMSAVNAPPRNDLLSMMAHSDCDAAHGLRQPDGQHHPVDRRGNDTTRNTMSGSVWPERAPEQLPEAARQSGADRFHGAGGDPLADGPLAHMRRTALVDTEIGGKKIRRASAS